MRVWLDAPPPPMVPVPMARRLVRMPVRPRTTSSCARCLPVAGVSVSPAKGRAAAGVVLLATQVAASPEAVRRRKSRRSIDTPWAPEYARVQCGWRGSGRLLWRAGEGCILQDGEAAVRGALDGGSVGAEELTAPPAAGGALLLEAGEPVLPEDGADIAGRRAAKGIAGEEAEHIARVGQQQLFGAGDDGVLRPRAERGEPQVPVEARLVGRVDARPGGEVLRFVAEGIRDPGGAVVRALELDLVAVRGHDREEAVLIGDAERLQRDDWHGGEREVAREHM